MSEFCEKTGPKFHKRPKYLPQMWYFLKENVVQFFAFKSPFKRKIEISNMNTRRISNSNKKWKLHHHWKYWYITSLCKKIINTFDTWKALIVLILEKYLIPLIRGKSSYFKYSKSNYNFGTRKILIFWYLNNNDTRKLLILEKYWYLKLEKILILAKY